MTPEQRHRCMAAIKGKDTKPEMIVRKYLFSRGLRFRILARKLPGRPDIVLPNPTSPTIQIIPTNLMNPKDTNNNNVGPHGSCVRLTQSNHMSVSIMFQVYIINDQSGSTNSASLRKPVMMD